MSQELPKPTTKESSFDQLPRKYFFHRTLFQRVIAGYNDIYLVIPQKAFIVGNRRNNLYIATALLALITLLMSRLRPLIRKS